MKTLSTKNSSSKNRLGRGLDVLLGPSSSQDQSLQVDIEKIYPNKNQPRKVFDKESLKELAQSIKEHGILQPLLLEKTERGYQIIAGERRWRSACMLGLRKVPAIVRSPSENEKDIWALIENIQREELNPIEEAQAFKKILETQKIKQEELADSLGRARSSIANSLRLLQLDEEVQSLVSAKKISFAQARELLRFKSPKEQKQMAIACVKGLTVKALSSKVSGSTVNKPTKLKKSPSPFWTKKILKYLEQKFERKISLAYLKGRGHLKIPFKSETDLKNLLDKILD